MLIEAHCVVVQHLLPQLLLTHMCQLTSRPGSLNVVRLLLWLTSALLRLLLWLTGAQDRHSEYVGFYAAPARHATGSHRRPACTRQTHF